LGRQVVAIDGLAGSGKTSIARELAKKLGWLYCSTGLLYRGVGALALHKGIDLSDEDSLSKMISENTLTLTLDDQERSVLLINGEPPTFNLFTPEASEAASRVAAHPQVRLALVPAQRDAFPGRDMVVEGRDMGTVIFPQASAKFFIDVPEELRIQRRMLQWKRPADGSATTEGQIKAEIKERDERDSSRLVAPTKPADDALIVNNAEKSLTEVVDELYHLVALRRSI